MAAQYYSIKAYGAHKKNLEASAKGGRGKATPRRQNFFFLKIKINVKMFWILNEISLIDNYVFNKEIRIGLMNVVQAIFKLTIHTSTFTSYYTFTVVRNYKK